ncbi:MAG: BamA/TamA family outer membrane protein, partial [Myxococcota bacterium]
MHWLGLLLSIVSLALVAAPAVAEPRDPDRTAPETTPDADAESQPTAASEPSATDRAARAAANADEQSASQVAGAPRPDQARNLVARPRHPARHLLWVPRALLFVPSWAVRLAAAPLRGGLFVFDRYALDDRLGRLLSGGGPLTLYPSAKKESAFAITYGIGASYKGYVKGRYLFGGEIRRLYTGELSSGRLFGDDLELTAHAEVQELKNSRFFGIGNGDLDEPAVGIDAQNDERAARARVDQEMLIAALSAAWQATRRIHLRGTVAATTRRYASPAEDRYSDADIAILFDPDSLVGFDDGSRQVYRELRALYDDRVQDNPYVTMAQPSRGWRAEGFVAYARGWDGDPSNYLHYGGDVQYHINLYRGDRILLLRGHAEGVTAAIDAIPFSVLPRLGGSRLMRGYHRGRFRDRVVTAATVEYRFPVNRFLSGFLFVDAGGAWRR